MELRRTQAEDRERVPCPHPWCREGRVKTRSDEPRTRCCPVCRGEGTVDETDHDLLAAGIVVTDPDREEFRSSPFHV